jgi:hypothetical protein
MLDEKWQDYLTMIKKNFEVEEELSEEHPEFDNGKIESIVFVSPMGKMKLVRITTPRVLDRKSVYSKRSGSDMQTQYEYSDTEFVNNLEVYKWNDLQSDWITADFNI